MLLHKPITELLQLQKHRQISARELVEEAYAAIERLNPKLSAFIAVRDKKRALKEADARDREEPALPLHGIPFCLKDAYVTKDIETTAGSRVLDLFHPPYDAAVLTRLRAAGAVLVGKNSMDAWGHGGSSENTDYDVPRNPYDRRAVAGGSSGGSAAAVAARMAAFAIGEDTGGSIRNPASMCGVTGLKPTYGRVSRYGTIAYASSLDTVGPIAKSADDAAHVLEVIAGADPKDATSSHRPVPKYGKLLRQPPKNMRLGVSDEFLLAGVDERVRRIFDAALRVFEALGCRIVPVRIPSLRYAIPIYYLVATSETASNLARYDGVRFGAGAQFLSEETVRRVVLGTYALKAGYTDVLYTRALKGRTLLIKEFDALWTQCDALLGPTLPTLPYRLGDLARDPMKMVLADSFTVPVNLAGLPALALPAGFSEEGLPVGIQIIGRRFDEETLLALGHAYQKETEWHERTPAL